MRYLARSFAIVAILVALLPQCFSQTVERRGTGIITGKITVSGKAKGNVTILLMPSERARERGAVAKAATDFEGRYRLTSIPAGRYNVVAFAPAMVSTSDSPFGEFGRMITLAEGEIVDDIDLALKRGGVVTGRVTDSEGSPVVNERIQLNPAGSDDGRGRRGFSLFNNYNMSQTDDRGVYRLYGLMPGRYTVSVGEVAGDGAVFVGFGGRSYFTRTFHPSETEVSKATIIEVTEGGEIENVDITVGRKLKTFVANGRVVDDSGKPMVGARIGYGAIRNDKQMGGFGSGARSDAEGRFRIDGLSPGKYAAFVWSETGSDVYSDPLVFEIAEGDISGLEVRVHSAASISGVVTIEGTADRSVLARLSELTIAAAPSQRSNELSAPTFPNARIAADGSFRLAGMRTGKFRLYLGGWPQPQGFILTRVEREGIEQREIDVTAGAQVTGVRVVLEYGTGSVRGIVKTESGAVPDGIRLNAMARRMGNDSPTAGRSAQVDARGRFLIEGLPAGEYEIILQAFVISRPQTRLPTSKQIVAVAAGIESEVSFTFDPNAPVQGGRP